jgi:hypothetical protein
MTGSMGMSDETPFKIPLEKRVRLKGDRADIYPRAYGGAEAIVKKHSVDPIGGYPMVYVEWDKKHWTYQGERDMWTFEDHFDVVEDEKPPPPEPPRTRTINPSSIDEHRHTIADPPEPHHPVSTEQKDPVRRMVERAQERHNRERIAEAQQPEPSPDGPSHDDYMKALTDALEEASEAEAFMVISVARKPSPFDPEISALIPNINL